jgi:hypothetical protein
MFILQYAPQQAFFAMWQKNVLWEHSIVNTKMKAAVK